jgi:1-aminocyclopropane-1-carboxylate deaminase
MKLFNSKPKVRIHSIEIPDISHSQEIFMLRLDEIHPIYGGNKYFKLKYHVKYSQDNGFKNIISFGGPFSNHLFALAGLGKELGFQTFGLVRGYPHYLDNPTLTFCKNQGMKLIVVEPKSFDEKAQRDILIKEIENEYGHAHVVADGGSDELGIKGAEEILTSESKKYNTICCAIGTAGTISGIIRSSTSEQKVLGFSALKGGEYLDQLIANYTSNYPINYKILHNYHFGGFAKQSAELEYFRTRFEDVNSIKIDPIYQVKMILGLRDLIKKDYFSVGDKILIIHSGGLQAEKGFNYLQKLKSNKHG